MTSTHITELADIIQKHTREIDEYINSHNLPTPSFDVSHSPRVPLPSEIQSSQIAVLDASDELTALMLGPIGTLIGRTPFNAWSSVQAIERFGPAKAFPADETSSFRDIARTCSLSESDTRRIIHHAIAQYIFQEPSPGVVAHTAASKALAEIPPLAQCVGWLGNEMWPSSARLSDAMQKWPGSEESNETGFAIAYDTNLPMFQAVSRDPERAKRMAGTMSCMHSGPSYSIRHVIDHFDWGSAAQGLLIDVGGGRGTVATEIARSLLGIRCIVQDLPEVIQGAVIPEDLREAERLQFMAHDFFLV